MPELEAECAVVDMQALAKIPPFPPIVLRVVELAKDENVEVRKLVDLILSDAVFSAQILRLANSPMYGFQSRIDNVQHALVVLGLARVQSLAMTVATASYLEAALKTEDLHRCWRHTLACAILSEELGRVCSLGGDRAYTAGLLHDLGRLGLLVAHPAEYAEMLRDASRNSLELLDCERQAFGLDHCEAGRLLAEQWSLPEDVRMIAGRHHDPPGGSFEDLLPVVHWGCRLADSLGYFVIPPLKPCTLGEVRAALPANAQGRFTTDAEVLKDLVETRLLEHDAILPVGVPAVQQTIEPDEAQIEDPGDPPPPAADAPPQAELVRSLRHDLLTVAVTGTIFTLTFLLTYYLASR